MSSPKQPNENTFFQFIQLAVLTAKQMTMARIGSGHIKFPQSGYFPEPLAELMSMFVTA
jgi:hypothetical protein